MFWFCPRSYQQWHTWCFQLCKELCLCVHDMQKVKYLFVLPFCSAWNCTQERLDVCKGKREYSLTTLTHYSLEVERWLTIRDERCCITSTGDAEHNVLVANSDKDCIFFINQFEDNLDKNTHDDSQENLWLTSLV